MEGSISFRKDMKTLSTRRGTGLRSPMRECRTSSWLKDNPTWTPSKTLWDLLPTRISKQPWASRIASLTNLLSYRLPKPLMIWSLLSLLALTWNRRKLLFRVVSRRELNWTRCLPSLQRQVSWLELHPNQNKKNNHSSEWPQIAAHRENYVTTWLQPAETKRPRPDFPLDSPATLDKHPFNSKT